MNDKFFKNLQEKVDHIKQDHIQLQSQKKYDQVEIKNIVKENLRELSIANPYLNRKYDIGMYLKDDLSQDLLKNPEEDEEEEEDNQLPIASNEIHSDPKMEEIRRLEHIAFSKAKELETHIDFINQKRIELIIKDFRDKLIEENQNKLAEFSSTVENEYRSTIKTLAAEHSNRLNSIQNLQKKVDEVIDYCRMVSLNIKEQKVSLISSYEKSCQSLELEKKNCLEKYEFNSLNYIESRVSTFKKYLYSSIIKK